MEASLKRRNELTKAAIAGELTDEQRGELESLVDETPPPATVTKKTTVAGYLEWAQAEIAKLSQNPDPFRQQLLKDAADKVTALGKDAASDTEVEFEVAKEVEAGDLFASVLEKLKAIGEAIDALKAAEPVQDDEVVKQQGLAVQLASEVLTAYAAKLTSLKTKLDAGTITNDDVNETFRGHWDVQSTIDLAISTMAKVEDGPAKEDLEKAAKLLIKAEDPPAEGDDPPASGDDPPAADDPDVIAAADPPDKCPSCGADMGGKDACPECKWKVGDKVEKRQTHPMDYNPRKTKE